MSRRRDLRRRGAQRSRSRRLEHGDARPAAAVIYPRPKCGACGGSGVYSKVELLYCMEGTCPRCLGTGVEPYSGP